MVQFDILHGSIMYLKNIAFEPAQLDVWLCHFVCID